MATARRAQERRDLNYAMMPLMDSRRPATALPVREPPVLIMSPVGLAAGSEPQRVSGLHFASGND